MGAKHRVTELPQRTRSLTGPRARRGMSRSTMICVVASALMLCAATLAVLVVNAAEAEKTTATAAVTSHGPPQAPQPVSQEGTLIAVSADSVTARSANGYVQTYLVTANTTVITKGGNQLATAASHFTVNDEVDIVGTIQGGKALANAVADRDAGHGDGPPMDHVEGQAVTPASA